MSTAIAHTPTTQIATARHIARAAEHQIKIKTGMRMTVVLCQPETEKKTPESMLHIIASALGMNYDSFRIKGRARDIVELRFLSALLLRRYFPYITLMKIGSLFGGQDHTSVMNALTRANNLLDTNDISFCTKYHKVVKTINQWIKEQ